MNNALPEEVDNHMTLSSYTMSTNSFYHHRKVIGGQPSVKQLKKEITASGITSTVLVKLF